MIYVGIDPGLSGGVAICDLTRTVHLFDTPTLTVTSKKSKKREYDIPGMVYILRDLDKDNVHVGLEKVHAMPKQGVRSMFTMGEGYGIWQGILSTLEFPYTLITPQAWKKKTMAGMKKGKDASVLRALQLYPSLRDQLITPRGRKIDGRADALLIAEYLISGGEHS